MNQGRRRRAITAVLLAGLVAFAAPAVAQDAQTQGPPDENGTIGPRELQKFELPGTRTNPAYQTPDTPSDRTPATEPPKKSCMLERRPPRRLPTIEFDSSPE